MILEIKSHSTAAKNQKVTEASIAMVKEMGMLDQVEWIAFSYDICKQIRAALPNAVVQYLNGDKSPATLAADKITAIDYNTSTLNNNPNWITEAHSNNMFVNVWTITKAADIKPWIAKNVDVITTDVPKDCMNAVRIYVEK